jgi:5-oxoprolinase (ATP-hydrolysing) subunit A
LRTLESGTIITASGKSITAIIDTICVHGDSPSAVTMAKAIRQRLEHAGHTIAPFADIPAPRS